jgi:FlaG/FlaF family flagellin (archaellin)
MVEGGTAAGYDGPMIADNTITSSPGRTAPAAVGLVFEDCSGVSINSARNTVTLSDNALAISNCDVSDISSVLQGHGDSSTIGIDADDANGDHLTLTGTTITGFATGVKKTSGELTLTGDASLTGEDYGVYVDDASVIAINAAVNGGALGTGLHVVDSDDVWVYPMDASGLVGMYVENSPFRWDGGTSTADTSLQVVESQGSVENMTWPTTTYQIDAGSNAYVTSIGNTITDTKLIVATSATIDEANLFTMDSTHLSATINPADHSEVSMLIQSTDGTRASYVSSGFQPETMNVDGDDADWNGGNALNPSGYAMPGIMSGDGTNDMMVTYIEGDDLYIGLTGEDLAVSDVLIYLSVDGSGSSTGYNLGGSHILPFQANYVLWADSDSSFDLYSYGFLGWGPTSLSTASVDVSSSSTLTEISIPFSRMGGTPSQIDIVAIVQGETTADVSTVHPTQTIDSNILQTFTEYMTVELTHDDLADGSITDEVLVYRSYKGSSNPSVAKNYDVMIKTDAECAQDWATSSDLSLATNIAITLDMARACPEVQTSLADITVTEDSGEYTFSLLNEAVDIQTDAADLSWTSAEDNLVSHLNLDIVTWDQIGKTMTITTIANQFGTLEYEFEVTDSNGLTDNKTITFEVTNVNDAPVICNVLETNCLPIAAIDDIHVNILSEGFGMNGTIHSHDLGNVSNASKSYIRDMANEQSPDRQQYVWSASVESTCIAFSVDVISERSLEITENESNEKGGTCTITLDLSDNGNENNDATSFLFDFSVAPVNDAPYITLQDENSQNLLLNTAGDRATAEGEYIDMTEDDTNVDNLTWNLLPLMNDIDHDVPADLTWTVQPTSQCDYTNYFSTEIIGTDLVFTLVPDATTNGYDWEIDYMNDNGIHQLRPEQQTFCAITLVLKDTATAPAHTPNYDPAIMSIADYQNGSDSVEMYVTINRVAENVADYSFNEETGINFNGITNIMTGTYIPVSVDIKAGGDEGPYNYDHMLAVTFHTDGHSEVESTSYYNVPAYGTSKTVNESIYITKDTTHVEVSMDVLTCLVSPCDLTVSASERFQADDPQSHRASQGGAVGAEWSNPGQFGAGSERRPMLEDNYWCNNRLTTLDVGTAEANSDWGRCNEYSAGDQSFSAKAQNLPNVVRTIGASSVPSFAPSIIVVSLTGLFVSALAFSSRRAEDEEEATENLEDDDMAVSPVIATILMVAITVVLSGVIYVWASSLADTDVKGVPRITFDIEDVNSFEADGHWKIEVRSSETDLATQAVEVRLFFTDVNGDAQVDTWNLADTNNVYGFNPGNSDSMVTFVDQVTSEGDDKVSTFNTGDTIFVRTHDTDGTPLEDVTITLSYAPGGAGQGALLRSWSGLSYDLSV